MNNQGLNNIDKASMVKSAIDSKRLKKILDSSVDIICSLDKEGRFVDVSAAAYYILGYTPQELIGKYCTDINVADQKLLIEGYLKRIMTINEVMTFETEAVKKNGGKIPLCWSGKWDKDDQIIYCIARDESKRKEAELKLRLSERKCKALVQNGFDMFIIIDMHGNYQFISNSVYTLMGYTEEDLIGTNAFRLIHPDDVEKTQAALNKLYTQALVDDADPFRFLNSNNEWRWIEAKGANMLNDVAVNGVVINCRDITEKKLLSDKLNQEKDERRKKISKAIIKAQELERTQLSRELHDNVNQVLTTIKLYTELSIDGNAESKSLLQKALVYLNSCIDEIRSISKRLSTPTLGKINFSDSVKELVNALNLTDKINIHLEFSNVYEKLDQVTHLGIYRIIQEHLTNILRHAQAKNVEIKIKGSEVELQLLIVDDGKGFDVHSKRSGIGISNMFSRAESLNSKLKIKSSPGNGCRLLLTVPI